MLKKLTDKIARISELPQEVVLNVPLIAMRSNNELTIENYKGIIEYSEEVIRISSSIGVIKVRGNKLYLRQVSTESIRITGVIAAVEFSF